MAITWQTRRKSAHGGIEAACAERQRRLYTKTYEMWQRRNGVVSGISVAAAKKAAAAWRRYNQSGAKSISRSAKRKAASISGHRGKAAALASAAWRHHQKSRHRAASRAKHRRGGIHISGSMAAWHRKSVAGVAAAWQQRQQQNDNSSIAASVMK